MVIIAMILGISLILIVILFGDNIVTILFTKEYIEYKTLTIVVMVTGLFWYISGTLYYGVIALNLYKAQMIIFIISFVVNVGVAFALMFSMISRVLCFCLIIIIEVKKYKKDWVNK